MPIQRTRVWPGTLSSALLLLAPLNLLASLGMDIYLPAVPAMPSVLDTSSAVVQLTLSLYMIGLGVGQVVFGPLSDRIGRRPVFIGGALLFAVTSGLLALVRSGEVFLLLRLLQAVGASAALVAIFATVRDVYAARPESTQVYGLLNAMLAFVPALGPIIGALVLRFLGWPALFIVLAVPAAVSAIYALARWPETRSCGEVATSGAFRAVLMSGAFWAYTMAFSTAMGTFFVFFSTAPRVLMEQAGYSELGFSLAFATAAAVMIGTARLARPFVTRWGTRGSVFRGMAAIFLGGLLLALGQMVLEPSMVSFIVPMWVVSVGIIITASVTANGALKSFGQFAGTAVALHYCIQSLLVGIVGTIFVVMLDGDTAWPLAAFAGCMSLATVGAVAALRTSSMAPTG